jgi:hypothetical protein
LALPGLQLTGNGTWSGTGGTDVGAGAGTTQVFVNAAANAGTVNASAVNGVLKLTTGATSFAAAIGTTSVTTTGLGAGEVVMVTWYDTATGQMVLGFVNSAADGTADNITQNDLFVEVVRVGMTTADYAALTVATVGVGG